LSGQTVHSIFQQHGADFSISLSGLYRHSRNHMTGALALSLVTDDGPSTGDLVNDLATLRANLLEAHNAAMARGAHGDAVRSAHEAAAISSTLLRELGVDSDSIAADVAYLDRIRAGVRRATLNRPAWGTELAEAFRALGDDADAEDAEAMTASATTYLESTQKKEAAS
jgi:hypothetical protein